MLSPDQVQEFTLLPELSSPWMNAAGFLGFIPPASWPLMPKMGAFVTNPISLLPRSPAHNRAVVPFPGGYLLHTGFPNNGLIKILKKHQQKWSRLPIPIWAHLLSDTPYNCQKMVRVLEGAENVSTVELSFPCDLDRKLQVDLVCAAVGELPIFVAIPLNKIDLEFIGLLPSLGAAGVVISAPRGSLTIGNKVVSGRLYGPALFPQLLQAVVDLKDVGLPVIAGSGIFSFQQGEAALSAGASAVQFDGMLWQF
jgi:dihydroorotate dehydrogenase